MVSLIWCNMYASSYRIIKILVTTRSWHFPGWYSDRDVDWVSHYECILIELGKDERSLSCGKHLHSTKQNWLQYLSPYKCLYIACHISFIIELRHANTGPYIFVIVIPNQGLAGTSPPKLSFCNDTNYRIVPGLSASVGTGRFLHVLMPATFSDFILMSNALKN